MRASIYLAIILSAKMKQQLGIAVEEMLGRKDNRDNTSLSHCCPNDFLTFYYKVKCSKGRIRCR